MRIGVGGVPQTIPHKIEGQNADYHEQRRQQQPGGEGQHANGLGILEQHSPADGWRLQTQANKELDYSLDYSRL